MESRFLAFVWKYSKREQILILLLTVATFPLVYLSLELPKIIVNEAIDGTDFPKVVMGVPLAQVPYLLFLCACFLGLVLAINAIKWVMNVMIGMCGERMLRRLRYMLFERVMRFRMERFRSTRQGEVIQSLLGEIEPLGGFIGEVIATPTFQGGLLAVYVTFIFVQDPYLGLAAIAFYPLQMWLIPILQKKVIRLNKERARSNRALADVIAESVGTAADIQTNDTARWHIARISRRLHTNTLIRAALFRRKYTIKLINNVLNQLTPFFFYAIGGYLVIRGRLDFGALVAVLAAYKDLAAPWKALLAYVQRWTDFSSRYRFVIDGFGGGDVLGAERIWAEAGGEARLAGPLVMTHVRGGAGTGGLEVPFLRLEPGRTLAVTGGESAGARDAVLRLAAGLERPAAGSVLIGEVPLSEATLPQIGRTVGFVSGNPTLIGGSIRQNLAYSLFRRMPGAGGEGAEDRLVALEAERTGNLAADPEADWIDYAAAGVPDRAALEARLHDLVERTGLAPTVLGAALHTRLDLDGCARWTPLILRAREAFAERLTDAERHDLLEPWDRERFNANATLLENVLFALPAAPRRTIEAYVDAPEVASVLEQTGAAALLREIGEDVARHLADLVATVGESSPVLDSLSGFARAQITSAAALLAPTARERAAAARRLAHLGALYVEQRDGLDVLGDDRLARLMACRRKAAALLADRDDFVAFDADRVRPAETLAENILNAKRRHDRRFAWRAIDARLDNLIAGAGLRADMLTLGLGSDVGSGGSALTAVARRRVALVRALVKRPALVVLDGVAAGSSAEDRALRATIRGDLPGAMLLYAAIDEAAAEDADEVAVIDDAGTLHQRGAEPERRLGQGP